MKTRLKRLVTRTAQLVLGRTRAAECLLACRWIDRNQYNDLLTDEIMNRCIPRDGVCVDVGCHSGSTLQTMVELAPAGRHLAFEPLPDFYAGLQRDFSLPNVTLFNVALSNTEGTTTFKQVVNHPAYSGLKERRYDVADEFVRDITVRTRTLDAVVDEAGVQRLDFVKIDVEGAERLVMEGARRCFARFEPTVAIECGLGGADFYGTKPEQIFDLMVECGLRVALLGDFVRHRGRRSAMNSIPVATFFLAHP